MNKLTLSLIMFPLLLTNGKGVLQNNLESSFQKTEQSSEALLTNEEPFYEQNYSNDKVIVTFTHEASVQIGLKEASIEQKIDCVEFESYTELLSFDACDFDYAKDEKYKTIVSLELKEKTRENIERTVAVLERDNDIASVSPNYFLKYCSLEPEDPLYLQGKQWGLNGYYGINAEDAWNITTGSSDTVTVGIIDSGIYEHDDLIGNIEEGYDFYFNNTVTDDDNRGHGTEIAGIIAATSNQIGCVGIAPNVKIKALQISQGAAAAEEPSIEAIISAISYAKNLWGTTKQISVLNFSFDGFGRDQNLYNAAIQFPGPFIWAAGNDDLHLIGQNVWANVEDSNIIGVGAMTEQGERRASSNYGDIVSIFAPGERLWTTTNANGYAKRCGTSHAAGFVSGVAALLLSKFPGLSTAQIKESILNGAIPFTYYGDYSMFQTGKRLSAYGALNYASVMIEKNYAPLRIRTVGKSGSNWTFQLFNPNSVDAYASYSKYLCSEQNAKNFSNLAEIQEITIPAHSSRNVTIVDSGSNQWMTVSIGYTIENLYEPPKNCRIVSCTNDLRAWDPYYDRPVFSRILISGTHNKNFEIDPGFLSFSNISSSFLSYSVRIVNNSPYKLTVSYNSKLCFLNDARTFTGLYDVVTIDIPRDSYASVIISNNFFADYFTAKFEFFYHGASHARISYRQASNSSLNTNEIITY